MEKEKYCPLRFRVHYPESEKQCIKKKCAWWDNITGLCAITVIARFGSEGSFYRHRQEQKELINRARGG